MTFISGNGVAQGPAKAVLATPEQEAQAARKLQASRELRAKRKAEQASGVTEVTSAPVVTAETQSSEDAQGARLPWQGQGEGLDLNKPTYSGEPRNVEEAEAWAQHHGVIDEHGVSRKLAARRAQDAKEHDASESGDIQNTGKLAYLNTVADDEAFEQARQRYERAEGHLSGLTFEQASFTGRMQQAIEGQDFEAMASLRERQGQLPHLILAARFGATQAELAYVQLRAARDRIAKQIARQEGYKAQAEIREREAQLRTIQHAVIDAETRSDDSVRAVGDCLRKLDALKAEAMSQATSAPAHRAPTGMVEYGADLSNLGRMG